jgi:hypothetical protein
MTDLPATTAPSGDLVALASRINAEHAEVIKHVQQGADHAIRAGKLLLESKIAVRHGYWSEWVATNLRVSERTAQVYMQLAREYPQGLADTSMTAAIKMLEQAKSPEEKMTGVRQQRVKRNPVAEAIKVDPVAILEKAWAAASENERNIFVRRIEKDFGSAIQPGQPLINK